VGERKIENIQQKSRGKWTETETEMKIYEVCYPTKWIALISESQRTLWANVFHKICSP
jgi:hypothetical protein